MSKLKTFLVGAAVLVLFLGLTAVAAHAEGNKTGIVTGDALNVRESADTSAKVLTQLSKGMKVTVLESVEGWCKISCSDVTGWVSGKFLNVQEAAIEEGVIIANDVNLRGSASTSADVLGKLDKGVKVTVVSRSEDWYKVKTPAGAVGWIYKEYISLRGSNVSRGAVEDAVTAEKTAPEVSQADSPLGAQLVEYGKKFLGVKYVYGGSSPKGFDCSGFSSYVYSHFGIKLERVAANQANHGVKVDKANLQPGDLVLFDTNGGRNYINHVGIYIGNGQFIHASSGRSSHKVVISDLSGGFYANAYMTARRMIK